MSDEYGTITPCYTMTFVRKSKHSAAKVWAAITQEDAVSKWMDGSPASIDLRVGGHYKMFRDGHPWLGGIVIEVEPERALAYVWVGSVVRWTLEDTDDGCTYTFVHHGCADRGEDEEGLPAGWHSFLDQLDMLLDGTPYTEEQRQEAWHARKLHYREALGRAMVRA